MKKELYGLVICGGKSTRMGTDKSLIDYHGKPQCYYVYEMLEWICDKVFISCNSSQATGITGPYATLTDLPQYENIGPMAALLTAFNYYPHHDFLIAGCDYPYITTKDLKEFYRSVDQEKIASTFYNHQSAVYEPLLGWYSQKSKNEILHMYDNNEFSLQHFLKENGAGKYEAPRPKNVVSVDTPEDCQLAKESIIRKIHF
ncbi:molybdenum cofactor guanylyltransferase [Dyadobacter frigoris]|uniref:Probable molybdenum cofactor guanylyltransferase n=1 Tax=Dyadobacter frigoris TaxID=2576211 RepID=A0A4U6D6Y7_9BACT|nr:NTP transferase domain-containing protein [Dyadobacter frigoris]TKT93132.1 molybdenum cofactor guanylyltransferase [Dyadobacter frigoris]GLU54757.1 putative molybdenum cofactor guanylyltransferase [Dyadobacter frigoris]